MNISVVIPVFPPHFCFLERCLQNVMQSTVLPNEIIIAASEVNEKKEKELYDSLIKICKNVKLIIYGTTDIAYAGVNRNRGYTKSSNDIIMFIDADDFIHPQKVEIIQKCFEKFPDCKQLIHNFSSSAKDLGLKFDIDNLPIFQYKGSFQKGDIVHNGMKRIHRGHVTVHRSVFEKVKYNNDRHREDNTFTKKVHKSFDKSFFLSLPLLIWNESGIKFRDDYYNNKN